MSDLRQAFERLAVGFQKPLYNAALRLAGNSEDGLDLARETFVRAYSLYISGRRSGAFRPWLYQILVEVYLDRRILSAGAPAWLEGLETRESRNSAALERTRRPEPAPIDEALLSLTPESRIVFILCDLEGFTYAQIARILRISQTQVSGRVLHARRSLRSALRDRTARRPHIER